MLEAGLAKWQHFKWSLDAAAHADQQCLEQVLQRMEVTQDKKIVEALREHGDTVHIITKTHAAVQNVGLGRRRRTTGCWCHELSERWRFDEQIFEFLTWLRVDEVEQVPLAEAVREARRRFPSRGEPDVSLVISLSDQINERENRRLAPADALLVEYEARGAVPTNAPAGAAAHRSGR
eukprot:s5222_g2.t1